MKLSENVSRSVVVLVVTIISFAYAVSDSQSQENMKKVIDLGPFTFDAPSGDEWKADINKESGEAQFTKQKKSFFGGGLPLTLIHVSHTSVLKEEMWKMTEEEVAKDYRDGEYGNMMIQGVLTGAYRLEDVNQDTSTLNGKNVYTLSYKQMGGRSFGDDKVAESTLYLYFPQDFKKNHTFYRILISQFSKIDKRAPLDPGPAIAVINSIRTK